MTNKLVVIINSLKVPKIKKIFLYEMKFLVQNYSCLQNPWLGGYVPRSPFCLSCPQLNLLNPPPRKKFLGTPLSWGIYLLSLWAFSCPLHENIQGQERQSSTRFSSLSLKNGRAKQFQCSVRTEWFCSYHLYYKHRMILIIHNNDKVLVVPN